jgi:hypothetical protein
MDLSEDFKIYDRTRRAEVNWGATVCARYFWEAAKEAIAATEILKDYNFDARDQTREESISMLEKTIRVAKATKLRYLKVRRELDSLIFNLDWFIRRCDQDLKRFRCQQ